MLHLGWNDNLKTAGKTLANRECANTHDLLSLVQANLEPTRQRVRIDRCEHWFEKDLDVITNARYRQENGTGRKVTDAPVGALDDLITTLWIDTASWAGKRRSAWVTG